jgi:hypothetical protein
MTTETRGSSTVILLQNQQLASADCFVIVLIVKHYKTKDERGNLRGGPDFGKKKADDHWRWCSGLPIWNAAGGLRVICLIGPCVPLTVIPRSLNFDFPEAAHRYSNQDFGAALEFARELQNAEDFQDAARLQTKYAEACLNIFWNQAKDATQI